MDKALEIYENLERPSNFAHTTIIKGLVNLSSQDAMDKALQIYKRLERPNNDAYEIISHGLQKEGSSLQQLQQIEIEKQQRFDNH